MQDVLVFLEKHPEPEAFISSTRSRNELTPAFVSFTNTSHDETKSGS